MLPLMQAQSRTLIRRHDIVLRRAAAIGCVDFTHFFALRPERTVRPHRRSDVPCSRPCLP